VRVLMAHVEDVMREASARWTLVAYFFLSTLFIAIFASAINLDVVDGALAGASLFGRDMNMRGSTVDAVNFSEVVLGVSSVFAVVLYAFCTFLAIFATAHLVPRLQEKGTIDLYLSRPVSRVKMLLSRYLAGLILAGTNIVYLLGSIWLIMAWKTEVVNPRFLIAGGIMLFVVATLLAFSFLIGVITSSTAVSIMTTYGLCLFSVLLVFHEQFEATVSKDWQAWLIKTLYWIVPKVTELGQVVFAFVMSSSDKVPDKIQNLMTVTPFISTGVFAVSCLVLASWLFQRKEF
jgi:ABC-type transport system involved in multi-copper enzyme maturation permease subunit